MAWAKSLAIHAMLLLTFWVTGKLSELSFFSSSQTLVVRSSVKVDVVAMPKLTLAEIKALVKLNQRPVKGEVVPVKDKPDPELGADNAPVLNQNIEKKEKNFDDFLSKLSQKKLPAIKKSKGDSEKIKQLGPEQEKIQELLHLGNKLSKGLAAFGETDGPELQGALVDYGTVVIEKIKPFWRLPTYLLEKNLKCAITVFIDEKGNLLKTQINESSGTPEYDQRAVAALLEAAPFEAVPADISAGVRRGALVIGFPL